METNSIGPTDRLAAYVVRAGAAPLDDELSLRASTALLDAFGLGLAARGNTTLEAYVDLSQPIVDAASGGSIWGRRGVVSTLDAVAANALAVHARFQDDCDMTSWAHPGSLIVPPAVTLGESTGVTVDVVLRAVIVGYAVISWLGGEEVVGRRVVGRGFRASPVFGSIGAAATASVILGLDHERSRNALAIAADLTGGVLEPVGAGADDWRLQNATAAQRGVMAALLAQRGVVGAPRALEGANGLLHSFAGIDDVPSVWEKEPDSRSIMDVWAKPYPTLGDNMAVTAAALALRERGVDVSSITSVAVHQNAHFASYPGTSYRGPYLRPAQAMASTAYAVSATLLYGRLIYDLYRTNLEDAKIIALIDRLHVVPEPSYSYVDGRVVLTLADATTIEQAAKDLPRTLFYRDRESALRSFESLMDEVGVDRARAERVASTVFAGHAASTRTPVKTLVEALR